jgi:hypothetical protein
MTMPCDKIIVAKSKEVKTRWENWKNFLRKALAQ